MIMPEFNPFGQLLQSRIASDRFNEDKRKNALQEGYMAKQEGRAQGAYDAQQQDRSSEYGKALGPIASQLSKLTPEQRAESWPQVHGTLSRFMPGAVDGLTPEYNQEIESQIMGLAQWHDSSQEPKDTGSQTDIWRYAGLAEKQWEEENPGVPFPANLKMKAMMDIKRASALEAGNVRGAQLGADLAYKPAIAEAVETAKTGVELATAAPISAASKTGGLSAEKNMATYEAAHNAVGQVEKIENLITHLNESDAITGLGAEMYKGLERVKALVGSDVAAGTVADTEYLNALMGSEVFPLIKSLGIGARGMDTPAERKFLREVMTGEIPLNKQTLIRMATDRLGVAKKAINTYNKRVDSGSLDRFFINSEFKKQRIDVSKKEKKQPVLPDGVTEEDITETMRANNMTRAQVMQKIGE